MLTNRRLVSIVTGVLILVMLIPVGLSIWLARRQAQETFTKELDAYSIRVMMHTQKVIQQAKRALNEIDAFTGTPCSPAHLLALRRVAFSYHYVQEAIYVDRLQPRCSSLENSSDNGPFPSAERLTPDGYRAWLTPQNDIGLNRIMAALGSNNHIVMIDPQSFIDVLPYGEWPVDIALVSMATNRLIASNGAFNFSIWQQAQHSSATRFQQAGVLYDVQRFPDMGLALIAGAPLGPLKKRLHQQLLIWLPLGLLMSLATLFLLLNVLRRLQSPHYRMLDAIHAREIEVYYQPIVALGSGKVVGAEALARWPQHDGRYVSPDIFIPLAEQSGLMPQLTTLIVETVFSDLGSWLQRHPEQHISINLHPGDLVSKSLHIQLSTLLTRWQLSASQIALEITERGFADPNVSSPAIADLRRAGHAIYIDDFGTGYSSLSYLQNLEADILKIDKSFVDALEYKIVTPHIIEMAKELGLAMVAEGVETEGQLEWLRNHGVQFAQGWFYSKALPKEAFMAWAEENLRPGKVTPDAS